MQPLNKLITAILLIATWASPALASEPAADGHRLIGLLDYVSADYPGAVADGKITDQFEYDEQRGLLEQAATILARNPDAPQDLSSAVTSLRAGVDKLAPPDAIRADALRARAATVAHFKIVMAPSQAPDLAQARTLYAAQCASCHGDAGAGDGPAAAALTPKPANFTDPTARDGLSPYRVFNTTTFGVAGTSMRAFSELSDKQRWDLAFYVMALGHGGPDNQRNAAALPEWATLDALASTTDADLRRRLDAQASSLPALRTAAPFAAASSGPQPLQIALDRLNAAQRAMEAGDLDQAQLEAVSAYLEGFEPVEGQLSTTDTALTRQIEQDFMSLRAQLKAGDKPRATATIETLRTGIGAARVTLGASQTSWSIALASGLILLREGIEIVLLLALLLGLTTRAGRPEGKRAIHAGWIAALVAGALTWLAATHLIAISGLQRELIEGVVALLASAMLFSISYWFLAKLHGERWAMFLKETAGQQIAGGKFAALATISFLAAYREVFEMVLFYQSLLLDAPDAHAAIAGGAAAGAALLAIVAFSILKLGKKLPLTPFFRISGVMLYALSVIMLGKGLHALAEAGVGPLWHLPALPTIPALGIYPEGLAIAAQLSLILAGIAWAVAQRRTATA